MVRVAMNGMTEKDLEGNNNRPLPGMYHVMIDTVREMPDDNYVQLDFSVLAGTPEGQENKKLSQRFYITGKDDEKTKSCLSRLARVAVETGLMTRADVGKDLDIDFTAAEGRDCVIKVKSRVYVSDKTGEKVNGVEMDFLGIWATDHEEVQQVPKDPSFASNAVKSAPSPQMATAGASTNGNSRDFDDI